TSSVSSVRAWSSIIQRSNSRNGPSPGLAGTPGKAREAATMAGNVVRAREYSRGSGKTFAAVTCRLLPNHSIPSTFEPSPVGIVLAVGVGEGADHARGHIKST